MTGKGNITVFDGSNADPVMTMPKYFSENFEGYERTCFVRDGEAIVSSYRLPFVAHNASGFDSCVVLNSLIQEIADIRVLKTARGLISVSFRCVFEMVNTVEVPQYVKLTCTKPHIKGSLVKIGREFGLKPELLRREIEHSVIKKSTLLI